MDKLVSITLVNWYLFGAVDIPINGDVILFRGANGSGKSSLLDALQTLFAGGDENELLMNAASSDGRRSGRSLKSYVLGTVADAALESQPQSREQAYSYIIASFRRDGAHIGEGRSTSYSLGLCLFGRAQDPKVSKYRFIVDGRSVTSEDVMTADHYVRPWPVFERRLLKHEGNVVLPVSAAEFRQMSAERMSGTGVDQSIQPTAMLRALKNGIGFREQKCISQFTRDHILPLNQIDVLRVQNDYEEYRRIYQLLEDAKNRLGLLDQMIHTYDQGIAQARYSAAYEWCFHHAKVQNLEAEQFNKTRLCQHREQQIRFFSESLAKCKARHAQVQNARDEALARFRHTDHFSALKVCDQTISELNKGIAQIEQTFGGVQHEFRELLAMQCPEGIESSFYQQWRQAQSSLEDALNFEQTLIQSWPENEDHIRRIQAALLMFESLQPALMQQRDELKAMLDQARQRHEELASALQSAQSGRAKLHESTETVIELLAQAGIQAQPVCELVQIQDRRWQVGIERFLGSNREALVIGPGCYEEALRIFRKAKDQYEHLRQVKLINPGKSFGFSGPVIPGTAAALIVSESDIALRYLRGLLHNVALVTTEKELRASKRAITQDGMVASHGAISGGNRIRWVLLGQDARRGQADVLSQQLQVLQEEVDQYQRVFDATEHLHSGLSRCYPRLIDCVSTLFDMFAKNIQLRHELDQQIEIRATLEHNPDVTLQRDYEQANQQLLAHQEEVRSLEIALAQEERELERLNTQRPLVERAFEEAQVEALAVEQDQYWDLTLASGCYNVLKDKPGQTCEELQREALELKKAAFQASQKAFLDGRHSLTQYLSRYEPEDREAFVEAQPMSICERCSQHRDQIHATEMVLYLDDARQARETMLENFRYEVVAKLKDAFENVKNTFFLLNQQLQVLTFNNTQYQFLHLLVEQQTLRSVYDYVQETTDFEQSLAGTLFDEQKEHPGVKIIEQLLVEGRLSEISDYRNFYHYDILATDRISGTQRYFSELLLNGSGGEKQTPFYVALGASFMTAFKIQKQGEHFVGGVALALFDEAFSKMDGNNAQTALHFFKHIGLQVILAAPPESEVKVGPFVDGTFTILRSGTRVYLDYKCFTPEGKALLRSDEPELLDS